MVGKLGPNNALDLSLEEFQSGLTGRWGERGVIASFPHGAAGGGASSVTALIKVLNHPS
jgi:hypothetical protein